MLSTACLLTILAVYTAIRVTQYVVRVLELDVWDTLVYLGLAEYHAPPTSIESSFVHRRRAQTTTRRPLT